MSMDIVFMGTPDFAVPCLQALIDEGHRIKAVYTQPDRPKGRGHKLASPPVKELALSHNIPVCQPKFLRKPEIAEQMKSHRPQLCVVVAYGKLLPQNILDIPPLGCVNVHASLLPAYRGAAPIQWSVINGEKVTGATTMYMSQGLDEGDIILSDSVNIGEDETAGELHDRLSRLGAKVLMETVRRLEEGDAPRTPQAELGEPSFAPMLSRELGNLDFTKTAQELHNMIRGLNPWPIARAVCLNKEIKVFASKVENLQTQAAPGEIVDDKRLVVACGDKTALELIRVQVQGKKPVGGQEFMRGYRLKKGDRLEG